MTSMTVSLGRSFRGAEIMATVKAVAEQNGKRFHTAHDYEDGDVYRIGLWGWLDGLRVSNSRDEEFIRPDASYDQVVVSSHQWWVPEYVDGNHDPDNRESAVHAVREFGEALGRHLSGAAEAEKPSAWPQEVTVCALCQRIVSDTYGGLRCSEDGENPPTRTMQVVSVAS